MKILALLDHVSPKGFGMHSFVAEMSGGRLLVSGAEGHLHQKEISRADLKDYVRGTFAAKDIASLSIELPEEKFGCVAGWIGKEFEDGLQQLRGPAHNAPNERYVIDGVGGFWIDSPEKVYGLMKDWTTRTMKQAIRMERAHLANFMTWVLPIDPETRAAIWYTKPSVAEKERFLKNELRIGPMDISLRKFRADCARIATDALEGSD